MIEPSASSVVAAPPFGAQESARRIGEVRWFERRLFEVLGGWVTDVDDRAVQAMLATQSHHHAWHADLLGQCLPSGREFDPEGMTRPAGDATLAFVDRLGDAPGPGRTIEKLTGVYRVVLPRLIAWAGDHLARASTVGDAPTIRAVRLVLRDDLDDWRAGERELQRVIRTADDAHRAAIRQAELESMLLAAGGLPTAVRG